MLVCTCKLKTVYHSPVDVHLTSDMNVNLFLTVIPYHPDNEIINPVFISGYFRKKIIVQNKI